MMQGRGVYVWANGTSYTGEFVDAHREGHGTFTFKDGE